jgi:hypothetical protein
LTQLTIKSIKFGVKVGDPVPPQDLDDRGNVGRYVENVIKNQGIVLNSSGIDIPSLNMEVKTRSNQATSPFTICRMDINDVTNTDFKNSRVCQSVENLLIVRYCDILNIVTSVEVYNWNKVPLVHDILLSSYNAARSIFKTGNYKTTVRGRGCLGYFEIDRKNKTSDKIYQFRLGMDGLKKMEHTKLVAGYKLFEVLS